MVEKNETLLVGVQIFVKKPCTVPSKYKCIFHGQTNLSRGTYMYWFPVKNTTYARLIHEIERWYSKDITIKYGVAGTMEI